MNALTVFAEMYLRNILLGHPAPRLVSWEVTNRCNLRCQYCQFCDLEAKGEGELPLQELVAIANWLNRFGCRAVSLTGGECLIREETEELAKTLSSFGILTKISTNGLLIRERSSIVKHLHSIAVSLDGPEEYTDAVRGNGVFQKVIGALEYLADKKVRTYIQTSVWNQSIGDLRELMRIAREFKMGILYQPVTGSKASAEEISRYREHLRIIHEEKILCDEAVVNSFNGLDHLRGFPEENNRIFCTAGLVSFRIRSNGTMVNCPRNPVSSVPWTGKYSSLPKQHSCGHCWCAALVESNLVMSLNLRSMFNLARQRLWKLK